MAILEIRPGPEPLPVLGIIDWHGVMHRYEVSPVVVPGTVFACELPPSSGGDEFYKVTLSPGGDWRCTCKDYVCREKRDSGNTCKHIDAVSQHYNGLETFFLGIERWREIRRLLNGTEAGEPTEPLPY